MKRKTVLLTFSAMMAAVAFVILTLGSLFDVLDITAACLASFPVIIVLLEAGYLWAALSYGVTSVLSLLILANKTPAVFFAAFFGIYAIVRFLMQKISPVWLRWAVKMLSFNAMLALGIVLWWFVFNVGTLSDVPLYILIPGFVLAQAVFIMYDVAIGKLVRIYFSRFHDRVSKIFNRK